MNARMVGLLLLPLLVGCPPGKIAPPVRTPAQQLAAERQELMSAEAELASFERAYEQRFTDIKLYWQSDRRALRECQDPVQFARLQRSLESREEWEQNEMYQYNLELPKYTAKVKSHRENVEKLEAAHPELLQTVIVPPKAE